MYITVPRAELFRYVEILYIIFDMPMQVSFITDNLL